MGPVFNVIPATTKDLRVSSDQKARAVRTIAHYAHDADDLRELLDIIGLDAADRHPAPVQPVDTPDARATPTRHRHRYTRQR